MVFLYIYTLMLIISFTLKLGNKAKIVFKKTDMLDTTENQQDIYLHLVLFVCTETHVHCSNPPNYIQCGHLSMSIEQQGFVTVTPRLPLSYAF